LVYIHAYSKVKGSVTNTLAQEAGIGRVVSMADRAREFEAAVR